MYFPVEVAGALLSMGDCHGHQGDGESAATGVEASMNGDFRHAVAALTSSSRAACRASSWRVSLDKVQQRMACV